MTRGAHSAAPEAVGEAFRRTMTCVAATVAVITVFSDRHPHGTTVSAWTSLSMQPPMTLVALDLESRLLARLRDAGRFGINILAADQSTLATRFASKHDDKFDGVRWATAHHLPRIAGVAGWLACEVERLVAGGDHLVVFGRVVAADPAQAKPLIYHARRFVTHTSLPTAP